MCASWDNLGELQIWGEERSSEWHRGSDGQTWTGKGLTGAGPPLDRAFPCVGRAAQCTKAVSLGLDGCPRVSFHMELHPEWEALSVPRNPACLPSDGPQQRLAHT